MQWEPCPKVNRFHVTQILEFHICKSVLLLLFLKNRHKTKIKCAFHSYMVKSPVGQLLEKLFPTFVGWKADLQRERDFDVLIWKLKGIYLQLFPIFPFSA